MEEKLGRGKVVLLSIAAAGVIGFLIFDDPVKGRPPNPEVVQTQSERSPAEVAPKLLAEPSKAIAKQVVVEAPKAAEKPVIEAPKVAEKPIQSFREAFNKSIADSQKEAVKNAHKVMIESSLRQYEIVKRQGSATDVCIHANAIQGAYLGAEDEANYAKWRVIAQNDCKVAGVPSL